MSGEISLKTCTHNNSCFNCSNDGCLRKGDPGQDCPKYKCDLDGDCDSCEFIKQFRKDVYREE